MTRREAQHQRKAQRLEHAVAIRAAAVRICEAVARFYGFAFADLLEQDRRARAHAARSIICYLIRARLDMDYSEIGRLLGRHRTTILTMCRGVSRKLARWPGGSTALAVAQAEGALG